MHQEAGFCRRDWSSDWRQLDGRRQVSGALALLSIGAGNVSEQMGPLYLKNKQTNKTKTKKNKRMGMLSLSNVWSYIYWPEYSRLSCYRILPLVER